MIDLDVLECRGRHISVRHSVWREKPSSAWSHARILSHLGPTKHLYWVRAIMSGE